eukprot:3460049-Amphidinium_carterae.2
MSISEWVGERSVSLKQEQNAVPRRPSESTVAFHAYELCPARTRVHSSLLSFVQCCSSCCVFLWMSISFPVSCPSSMSTYGGTANYPCLLNGIIA